MDVPDKRGEEMSDMINRDEVLAIIAELKKEYPTHSVPDAEAKVALRKAADKIRAIEVVRGEWKRRLVDNGFNADWVCSECGYRVKTDFVSFNFCPNCGARMKGADDE